ncbi:MAG: hypothetical protein Fur0025_23550 [Oscillatoriaceae cyanobacterium]
MWGEGERGDEPRNRDHAAPEKPGFWDNCGFSTKIWLRNPVSGFTEIWLRNLVSIP